MGGYSHWEYEATMIRSARTFLVDKSVDSIIEWSEGFAAPVLLNA